MLLVRLCRLQVPRQWGESALKRGSCAPRCCRAPRCVGRCRAWSPGQAPRCRPAWSLSSDVSGDGWGVYWSCLNARRARSDATNSPQICELQVTGFRRPGRPRRRPPAGAAGQALEENVGTARGVKRARDVGVSVGVRPRGPSVQLRGSIPLPLTRADPRGRGPPCAGGHGRLAEAGACRSS